MTSQLPQLVDRKTLGQETGLPRSVIDHVFRELPVVVFPNSRKVFVYRADAENLIRSSTFGKDDVRR